MVQRQPIPFLGEVTERDIQELIRRVNKLVEDLEELRKKVEGNG